MKINEIEGDGEEEGEISIEIHNISLKPSEVPVFIDAFYEFFGNDLLNYTLSEETEEDRQKLINVFKNKYRGNNNIKIEIKTRQGITKKAFITNELSLTEGSTEDG